VLSARRAKGRHALTRVTKRKCDPDLMAEPRSAVRRRMRRGDYLEATRLGARRTTRFFIVFVFRARRRRARRLGVTVTRKVGGAVRRNRIKRLAREWFRSRRGEFGSCDLVLIAKRICGSRCVWRTFGRIWTRCYRAESRRRPRLDRPGSRPTSSACPLLGQGCRFHPSCSSYAIAVLGRDGAWRGGWRALRRLGRCHPFGGSGLDLP
jgi:ribonuclease P protein component/putative membrane protein insertion efficiency factor